MIFCKVLIVFMLAIERTAATISDFSQKQHFLNTVYEQFFQGFSVKVADTHGICLYAATHCGFHGEKR